MSIVQTLVFEMNSTFKMINQAVSRMDGDFWREDEKDWVYAYILFHIVEAIEFYNSNSESEWTPINDVSANSRRKETEALLKKDREFFEDYVKRVKKLTLKILKGLSDQEVLGTDGFARRGFKSILHKYIYVMRHCMYHLGELTKSLRARDMGRIIW
ncbi:MAG: hypothetical protein ACFFEW_15450 [Candidatus Thorarchaeota archaeon]